MDYGLHYFNAGAIAQTNERIEADVCVYGATASGVIAACSVAEQGKSVVLLQPGEHIGGMTTGGLGWTDYGKKHVIGGKARQFYRDLGALSGKEEEWAFAPSAARTVLDGYLSRANVPVYRRQFLSAVETDANGSIVSVRMVGGLRVRARVFIDATYEGDLLAKAGVRYHVGREPNRVYGETIGGVQVRRHHQFSHFVDPYVVPGDPTSGTLPGVYAQDAAPDGSGDGKIQAYNFRVCMTDDPELMEPWTCPPGYDESLYEIARRWFAGEKDEYNDNLRRGSINPDAGDIAKFDVLETRTANGYRKTDTNNHGPVSSDFIGANFAWPEADYAEREKIFQAHVAYQKGFYWFMANDPGIPEPYRIAYGKWGLARDEYADTGHWPPQLYVREARRMVSDYVLTEADTQHHRAPSDPVGMGSYNMDSHNCQRIIRNGRVLNEGDVQLPPKAPYGVSYRSIVPARDECPNLLVPVCLSASHIAYGSVRMEPVFMVLGESAAHAAVLALDAGASVQDVPYETLRARLDAAGQVCSGQ